MDEKLIKKAIKGNFKAYSLLVHSLKNEGYKLAYTILKNENFASDSIRFNYTRVHAHPACTRQEGEQAL